MWSVAAAVAAAVVAADRAGWFWHRGSDLRRYDGQAFEVASVIDSRTLVLTDSDGQLPVTRVRLWGVAEPPRPRAGRKASVHAERATARLRTWAVGRGVTLSLEPHRTRDRDGCLWAYATLADGEVLNEKLLSEGLVKADGLWSHREDDHYARIQLEARRAGRGMWPPPRVPLPSDVATGNTD